jgi:GNAT superfamily N-acetyltransferase
MAEIQYRRARPGDHPEIVRFQLEMALETENLRLERARVERGVRAVFEDGARGTYHVAEEGGRVVSSLLITSEWSDWWDGQYWWIQSVFVEPSHRGRGVFRGMYQYVKELAEREPAVRGLRLYVEKRNQRAQRVYASLGMSDDHYDFYEWMKAF